MDLHVPVEAAGDANTPTTSSHVDGGGARMVNDAQPFCDDLNVSAERCMDGVSSLNWPCWSSCSSAPISQAMAHWYGNSSLNQLPTEVLLHILGFLDVSDLLSTSRTSHQLRALSVSPILHYYRLRHTKFILPPLLSPGNRPSLTELMTRSIVLTNTNVVSRKLARSLVSIRLSRRLASRPSPEALVQRTILPPECVPGMANVHVVPGLVAKRRAIEKEQVKDGLRRWIASKWKGEVREREEYVRRRDENHGVGRVWRLTRFWERVSRGDSLLSH